LTLLEASDLGEEDGRSVGVSAAAATVVAAGGGGAAAAAPAEEKTEFHRGSPPKWAATRSNVIKAVRESYQAWTERSQGPRRWRAKDRERRREQRRNCGNQEKVRRKQARRSTSSNNRRAAK